MLSGRLQGQDDPEYHDSDTIEDVAADRRCVDGPVFGGSYDAQAEARVGFGAGEAAFGWPDGCVAALRTLAKRCLSAYTRRIPTMAEVLHKLREVETEFSCLEVAGEEEAWNGDSVAGSSSHASELSKHDALILGEELAVLQAELAELRAQVQKQQQIQAVHLLYPSVLTGAPIQDEKKKKVPCQICFMELSADMGVYCEEKDPSPDDQADLGLGQRAEAVTHDTHGSQAGEKHFVCAPCLRSDVLPQQICTEYRDHFLEQDCRVACPLCRYNVSSGGGSIGSSPAFRPELFRYYSDRSLAVHLDDRSFGYYRRACRDAQAALVVAKTAQAILTRAETERKETEKENLEKEHLLQTSSPAVSECVVCLERPSSVVLLPCRHCCLCKECSESLISLQLCPTCRAEIHEKIEVFIY